MSALTKYTTYDEIRAVLGVTDEELEDSTLSLGVYSSALDMELDDVDSGIAGLFDVVANLDEAIRTTDQQKFYGGVRLFATYAVARQLSSSLPLFSPKDITDGKAGISRFSDSPYKTTIRDVKEQFSRLKQRLTLLYDTLQLTSTATVTLTGLSVTSPIDPVTGL